MMNTMRIGTRLVLGFGCMMLLLIGLGIYTIVQYQGIARTTDRLYKGAFTADDAIQNAGTHLIRMDRGIYDLLLSQNLKQVEQGIHEDEEKVTAYLDIAFNCYPGDVTDIERVSKAFQLWTLEHDKIIELLHAGQREKAIAYAHADVATHADELESAMGELIAETNAMAKRAHAQALATARQAYQFTTIVLLFTLLIGITLALVTTRSITRPLQDGVNVLVSAASEIAATATQLASASTETASSVSETTTTVEEVKQTARVATDRAQEVSQRAQQTLDVSQRGEGAVSATLQGIQHIREQMAFVADSVVRLSEQSQAIGAIITSVDDLAEQSNLLAVNAAIEAAKAGEQGKGFAVVAREVKSLAEQSRQATQQVRGILHDIQKATAAVVMATEQGSKAVETGVVQSTEAGTALRQLAGSIQEAAQQALQIVAASQQQYAGIDQVTLAMESIREATAQNVGGARQLEEASRNLGDLGQRLKQMITASHA